MTNATTPPDGPSRAGTSKDIDERSQNLGCGVAFVIVGAGLLAQKMGWIPQGDWIWPAALIGIGVGYLFKALRK